MLTNNTEITENDIGFCIHEMVKCGRAYLINITSIGEPFAGALTRTPGAEQKKFILFSCCEAQEQNAKDNIKNIVEICNNMIKNSDPFFIAEGLNESHEHETRTIKFSDIQALKRTLH